MRTIKLTPRLARGYLDNAGPNRKVSQGTVRSYVADINAGHWTVPTIIVVNEEGQLIDGAHRCHAVVQADKEIPVIVVDGTSDMFDVFDTGRKRGLSQVLDVAGYINTVKLAAAINAALNFEYLASKGGWATGRHPGEKRPTTMREKMEMLDVHPDLPEDTGLFTVGASKATVSLVSGTIIALRNIARTIEAEELFDQFFTDVTQGEGLVNGDPAFALRRRLIKGATISTGTLTATGTAALWVRSWNAYLGGETLTKLYPKRKGFPIPEGLADWAQMG